MILIFYLHWFHSSLLGQHQGLQHLPGFCCLITFLNSFKVIGLFRISISSFSFGYFWFSRKYCISSMSPKLFASRWTKCLISLNFLSVSSPYHVCFWIVVICFSLFFFFLLGKSYLANDLCTQLCLFSIKDKTVIFYYSFFEDTLQQFFLSATILSHSKVIAKYLLKVCKF